jgi:PAS domain S-box-containing protein
MLNISELVIRMEELEASEHLHETSGPSDDFLLGGGEMGALARSFDWARTPLGPISAWPQSLRTTVSTCLNSRFPILVWWGPELVKIYNDAYRQILGAKHPQSMGAPGRVVWPEIWHIIGPMLEGVMKEGRATWSENQFLPLERHGFAEECYFTFSYSPIRDESGGVGGVLCAVTETTGQIIGERRLETLKELAAETAEAVSVDDACRRAMAQLSKDSADLPFAALYLLDGERTALELTGSAGLAAPSSLLPHAIAVTSGSPLARLLAGALESGTQLADPVVSLFDPSVDAESLPARRALLIPIHGDAQPAGVLVAGLSPHLALDDRYRGFVELTAGHIGSAVSRARAFEHEKRRAEALAELDRAKSAFFSNVSHEFRTPLTLILGPTEDALGTPERTLSGPALETIYRNELRLLKLVNALLDFSRIEAGRMQASYEATDLSSLTAELASMFRSAIERAGLTLTVDCPPLPQPVYVDREMWEKILLNLLSNALKFTLLGGIHVALAERDGQVELIVRDTGVGIAAADLPRIFERFHRVQGTRGRTQEGSGIGLALVNELVRLNGGTITVASEPGRGAAFTVSIPMGAAHIPAAQIRTSAARTHDGSTGAAHLQEALRWVPDATPAVGGVDATLGAALDSHEAASPDATARVLVADDNADMREYLSRIIQAHWSVVAVADGVAALAAVQQYAPDVILTDVMMPGMDGFELLRTLRADPATAAIPVMMLSARAGEEARVDALQSGADDYLVKPFSARELVARVRNQIMLVRHARERARLLEAELTARREAEVQREQLQFLFMQAPTPIVVLRGPEHLIELVNPSTCKAWGRTHEELIGRPLAEALPELRGQEFIGLLDRVYRTGEPYLGTESPAVLDPAGDGVSRTVYFNFVYSPLRNASGEIEGVFVIASDVTEQVVARNEMDRLRAQAEAANTAKDEFLAMLGHELRNPLAPIVTALQLMRLRADDSAERERGIIERQVNHLTRLVDDLLDVSRIARGKVTLKRERVEIAEAVARAIEVASPLLEQRRHSLHLRVPRHGLAVDADPERLRQIVSNLLTNAAKYTEPGGRIDIVADARDGVAVLRVRDTGVGIDPSMLPKIFDLFVQERQSTDRAHGGLGLGLTIVRNLVALHGGAVTASSDGLGKGSEFVVRLPLSAASGTGREAPEPMDVTALPEVVENAGGLRVLVVDDNMDAAQMLAEVLEAKGHHTRVAHDGLAALRLCDQFDPELALVDIGLPVMDGYELAQRLRAQGTRARLIAVTGYGQEGDRLRSKEAGFDDHLVKPIDFDRLDSLLAEFQAARG